MPTYEYKCIECGHHFEKMQRISDISVVVCPECGGSVERLITGGGGFLMNGSSSYDPACDTCCARGESCDNPKRCCEG